MTISVRLTGAATPDLIVRACSRSSSVRCDGAVAAGARDRCGCPYYEQLTLAEIGRVTGEHEATVSRHLTRTRRSIRDDLERYLRDDERLSDASIAQGFGYAMEDAGPIDLGEILGDSGERKQPAARRSI